MYYTYMPNDNNLTSRPFANLEERLEETTRLTREQTTTREVDYRAIANLLSSELSRAGLISSPVSRWYSRLKKTLTTK